MRPRLLCLLAATALIAGGCGNDDSSDSETANAPAATATQAATTPAATATAAAAKKPVTLKNLKKVSKNLRKEPIVPAQTNLSAPAKLLKRDVVKGKGKTAKAGDLVSVQYTGYSLSTGEKFDASWDRGQQPFQFNLGGGQVIPGWDQGVPGMKVGGRRELVIPPDLGYGASGTQGIAPNETLIFVIDLQKVQKG